MTKTAAITNKAYLNSTTGVLPEKVKIGYMLLMEHVHTDTYKTWKAAYMAAAAVLGFMPNTPQLKVDVPVGLYDETAPGYKDSLVEEPEAGYRFVVEIRSSPVSAWA